MTCSFDCIRSNFRNTYVHETTDLITFRINGETVQDNHAPPIFNSTTWRSLPIDAPIPEVPIPFDAALGRARERYFVRPGFFAPRNCSMEEFNRETNGARFKQITIADIFNRDAEFPSRRVVEQEIDMPVRGVLNICRRLFCCE